MLCIEYDKKNKLKVVEKPIPKIGPSDALIKVDMCGVCGSDLVKIKNDLVPEGTVLGHEVVGTIVDTGSLIKKWSSGQRVVIAHHVPCLSCHFCKSRNYSMCDKFKKTNFTPGGFSEFIQVTKDHLDHTSFLIPKGAASDEEIAFTEPLACCIRAVRRSEITTSSTVLISGLGSIGQLMGMLCNMKGAFVFGSDLIQDRLNLSKELKSCDESYNALSENLHESIMKKTSGRGVDIVFLCSGSDKSLLDILKYIRPGGRIIVFSSIPTLDGITNNDIYYKELSVIGCYSPSPSSLQEAYQMIITRKIKLNKLITDIVSLQDLPKEIDKCFTNESLKMMMRTK